MERRITRVWKPAVERVEGRVLLSLVTDIMAGNHNAVVNSPKVRAASGTRVSPELSQPSGGLERGARSCIGHCRRRTSGRIRSIRRHRSPCPKTRVTLHPPTLATTCCSQPTGTATSGEVKRQLFTAVYRGPYIITSGAFSSQSMLV